MWSGRWDDLAPTLPADLFDRETFLVIPTKKSGLN